MKKLFVFVSIILLYSFSSCQKEKTTPTQADEVTIELQKIIAQNGIHRIIVWDDKSGFPNSISADLGKSWTFSNGFITIGGYISSPGSYSRNLLYLDSYEVSNVPVNDGTISPALILHFKS